MDRQPHVDEEFIILVGSGQPPARTAKAGPHFSPQSPGRQAGMTMTGKHEELLAIAADLRAKADEIEAICATMQR